MTWRSVRLRKAWWGACWKIRDERVAKIMSLRLPHETEGLYSMPTDAQICACGALKSEDYPECLDCSELKYEELNREEDNQRQK
jgi:hypothetical protein